MNYQKSWLKIILSNNQQVHYQDQWRISCNHQTNLINYLKPRNKFHSINSLTHRISIMRILFCKIRALLSSPIFQMIKIRLKISFPRSNLKKVLALILLQIPMLLIAIIAWKIYLNKKIIWNKNKKIICKQLNRENYENCF